MSKEPEPPEAPGYVLNPLKRQSPALLRKIGEYCFDLAEYKEHQSWEEIEKKDLDDQAQKKLDQGEPVVQEEMVSCGKENCNNCPHGPYIYEYKREEGEVISKYKGKA